MNNRHMCVVDAEGYYKALVLQLLILQPDGEGRWELQYYTLKSDEALVDVVFPPTRPRAGGAGFIRPRWDGAAWVEGATAEEMAAWEVEHPALTEILAVH